MPFGHAVQAQQALAQSALPHVPELAQAATEVHHTFTSEMMAWELDHDPRHLLSAIALLQNLLHHQTAAFTNVANEAHAANNAVAAMAAELDHGGTPARAQQQGHAANALNELAGRVHRPVRPSFAHFGHNPATPLHPAALHAHALLAQQDEILREMQDLGRAANPASDVRPGR